MTPADAVVELDDALEVWSRWSFEDMKNAEPEEMAALARARRALDVLRQAHVQPVEKVA